MEAFTTGAKHYNSISVTIARELTLRSTSLTQHAISPHRQGTFVDDASFVDISGFMLHARFRKTNKCVSLAKEYCKLASGKSDIGLHAAIFVAGKFLERSDILAMLEENAEKLAGDFWLSRAAAGIAPIFIGKPEWDTYQDLIRSFDSEDAFDVLNYMLAVMKASSFNFSLKAYIQAPNHTFPQSLFFPKILILLAVSKNPAVASLAPSLHSSHPALKGDPFFRSMGFA